jgi:accessory gene regulator B
MNKLAIRLTDFVVHAGIVSKDTYEIYYFGFLIALEMGCCFSVGVIIAIFLHTIQEFLIFMIIFIPVRSYAGGLHLKKFWACFLCSLFVETTVLLLNRTMCFSARESWGIIVLCVMFIMVISPVETLEHRLEKEERIHCRKVLLKILLSLTVVASMLVVLGMERYLSLIVLTLMVVLMSQVIAILKYKLNRKF